MTEKTKDQDDSSGVSQGGRYDNDDERRLTADPVLTQYFEDLEDALHGLKPGRTREPLTWNGVEETMVTFDSIRAELAKSIPPNRPLPDQYGTSQTGR